MTMHMAAALVYLLIGAMILLFAFRSSSRRSRLHFGPAVARWVSGQRLRRARKSARAQRCGGAMQKKAFILISEVLFLCAWTAAQAFNPYLELNLDPKFLSDKGIRITFDRSRGAVRFLVTAAATVDPRNIEPGMSGIILEYGTTEGGDPSAPPALATQWHYVNGSCVAFFSVSEDSLPHGTLKLRTTAGSFVIGLQSIVLDTRHAAARGTTLEKTIDQILRVK